MIQRKHSSSNRNEVAAASSAVFPMGVESVIGSSGRSGLISFVRCKKEYTISLPSIFKKLTVNVKCLNYR